VLFRFFFFFFFFYNIIMGVNPKDKEAAIMVKFLIVLGLIGE